MLIVFTAVENSRNKIYKISFGYLAHYTKYEN